MSTNSEQVERDFWDKTDLTHVMDAGLTVGSKKSLPVTVSLRLDKTTNRALRRLAKQVGIPHTGLMRLFIVQGLERYGR